MRIKFFSQQNDTKNINFDEGVLILWPFFWGNVIKKICHFCLKSHNWRNLAVLQSRGSYSKIFLPTSIVTFDRKEANFESDIASEKWLQNQNAFIKIIDLGVILLEKWISSH